ncbi:hypothetical protein ACW0US_07180 [Xanthomonas euvesicatoria]
MRSDTTQLSLDIRPKPTAAEWRAAAEACAQQFPGDARRLRYYQEQAERYDRETRREAA